ncbi:MAG: Laminin sub domain 2, partial [Thermoleophilia bacterium]|nr:Laminin sub domain 2 [Thermoleophilia bacterium]
FDASDFNGIASVAYPTIGGGFTPGGAGIGPSPFSRTYSFSAGLPVTGNQTVTATDGSGRTNTATFRVEADDQAPTGGSISYTDGYYGKIPTNPQPTITFNKGTDFGGAGVGANRSDLETWVVQREEGDLIAGACNWGAVSWLVTATNPAGTSVADPLPLATDKCYQYRLVVTDHVGNTTTYVSQPSLQVTTTDWTPPAPFDLTLPTNPVLPHGVPIGGPVGCEGVPTYGVATPALDWTDATDSSLAEYRVYFDPSSGFPLAYASVGGATPPSNLTLSTRAAGLYWWKVAARDVPNNLTWNNPGLPSPQVQVGVDLLAPTASFGLPLDNAWVTTATPSLGFAGTDDHCLARLQVWLDNTTEAGAPTANFNGAATSYTPASSLTDGAHTWHVTALDVLGRSTRTAPADRTVKVDTQDPTSTITWPTTPNGGSAVAFTGTATDPLKNGAASGVASWRLRWSSSATGPWTTMTDPGCTGSAGGAINCAWNSNVATDGNYYFQLDVTDVAGRTWSTVSTAVNIDNTPPAVSFNSYSPVGGAASNAWWPGAPSSTLYYRSAGSGSVTVKFNASDFNGISSVIYPTIGGGFSAGGSGTGPTPYAYTYTFAAGAPITGTQTVTATDGSGRPNTATFRVEADDQAPVSASIDYLDDYLAGPVPPSAKNVITFAKGTDFGGAGVGANRSDLESWVIERADGDLVAGGTCTWGTLAWTTVLTNPAASPVNDPVAMATNKCYQYRIVVTDHVGNQTITTNTGALKVTRTDWTPPAPFDLQPPANPALPAITTSGAAPGCGGVPTYASATPTLDWTDATDSSLAQYRVYFDPSNAFPLAYTAVAGGPPTSNVTLPTQAAGLYWWKVAAKDVPNNLTWNNPGLPTPQVQVGIDVAAPTIANSTPVNGAWTSNAMPTLAWVAADDRCLARTQVWIDNSTETGAATAVAAGTEMSYTPAAPLTDGLHTWHVTGIDVTNRRNASTEWTTRIDTQDPTSTITWPTTPNGGSAVAFTGTATDPLKNGA